jgi:hypothetical protein
MATAGQGDQARENPVQIFEYLTANERESDACGLENEYLMK